MVSKTNKFSSFSTGLKSINPIIPNDTEHMRQYPVNFSVISQRLWLPLPCGFFSLSPQTYSKPSYSGYTNVPNSALPSVSFLNEFQVPSSILNSKFHFQTKVHFFSNFPLHNQVLIYIEVTFIKNFNTNNINMQGIKIINISHY